MQHGQAPDLIAAQNQYLKMSVSSRLFLPWTIFFSSTVPHFLPIISLSLDRWTAQKDIDRFVQKLYDFYLGGGLSSIMVARLCDLLSVSN